MCKDHCMPALIFFSKLPILSKHDVKKIAKVVGQAMHPSMFVVMVFLTNYLIER